jgi:hypothetical protein
MVYSVFSSLALISLKKRTQYADIVKLCALLKRDRYSLTKFYI